MKTVNNPNTILKFKGELVRVVGIAEGKTIIMQPIIPITCLECGQKIQYHVLEDSLLFQENAEPVDTLND